MKELQQVIDRMEPEEALAELVPSVKKLLSHLNEDAKLRFVTELIGGENNDKITSMVNL